MWFDGATASLNAQFMYSNKVVQWMPTSNAELQNMFSSSPF